MKSVSSIVLGLALGVILFTGGCSSGARLPFPSSSLPGEGTTVKMGQAGWNTGWFQARIFKLLMEELGYAVQEPVTLDNVAFYVFAAQGDVDFWANGWFPLHKRYLEYERVKERVEIVGYQVKAGALQGYLIDKKTADRLQITNLGDLRDPDIAATFDTDGDGRAELIGCNAGWACELIIEHHLDAYDLRATIDHKQGDYSALLADTVARYARGEPILFYTWTPNWTVDQLTIGEEVMWLGVPFSSLPDEPDVDTSVPDAPGCLESPCDTGFGINDIRVVAGKEFLDANPAARVLFELVEIPLTAISAQNALMLAGEDEESDIERHAQEWIAANRDLVDQWLEAARAAAR